MAKQSYDLEALAFACPHCGVRIQISPSACPNDCWSCHMPLMGHSREKHRVMMTLSGFLDKSKPAQKQSKSCT